MTVPNRPSSYACPGQACLRTFTPTGEPAGRGTVLFRVRPRGGGLARARRWRRARASLTGAFATRPGRRGGGHSYSGPRIRVHPVNQGVTPHRKGGNPVGQIDMERAVPAARRAAGRLAAARTVYAAGGASPSARAPPSRPSTSATRSRTSGVSRPLMVNVVRRRSTSSSVSAHSWSLA